MSTRCHLWWCLRKSAGYLELGYQGTDHYERVPYCAKHGETVREILAEGDYTIPYKALKSTQTTRNYKIGGR